MSSEREEALRKLRLCREIEESRSRDEESKIFVDERLELVRVRRGNVSFTLKFNEDSVYEFVEHELPDLERLSRKYPTLESAEEAFGKCSADSEDFLSVMSDLDAHCWVIDPVEPTAKDDYRRIVIDDNVTASVTVNVHCATEPPHIKLLGLNKYTDALAENIRRGTSEWDADAPFIPNLLKLLGIREFPYKEERMCEDEVSGEAECSICFDSRDEAGSLPSVVCEKCKQSYHSGCLCQWLSEVPSSMQRFNTVHGECPNCSSPILCPLVQQKLK